MQTNPHITKSLLNPLIILTLLFCASKQFYTQIRPQQQNKCYLLTTFPNQNILVHIRLPLIDEKVKIQIECYVKGSKIFSKQLKKMEDKITIKLDQDVSPGNVEQAQVCVKTRIDLQVGAQNRERIRSKGYLIWLTISSNFIKHIQNSQKQSLDTVQDPRQNQGQSDEQLLNEIKNRVAKMNATYQQQLNRFYINEKKQVNNDKYLHQLLSSAYIIAIIETTIIFCSIFVYVFVFYKYL